MMKQLRSQSLIWFIAVTILWSCQSGSKVETNESKAQTSSSPINKYPALGNQELMKLYSQADHVDILFYNLPISVSQDDEPSVKNTVLYISPASPHLTKNCKPLGRLSWIGDGKILREADVFIEEGCTYLLFMENNQPVFANAMGPEGLKFFNTILDQAAKQKK